MFVGERASGEPEEGGEEEKEEEARCCCCRFPPLVCEHD